MVTRGVLAGACCALVIACGASKSTMSPAAPAAMAPSTGGPANGMAPREEIQALDREIEAQLTSMGVRPPPPPPCVANASCAQVIPQALAIQPAAEDPTCKPGPSDTCKDSCTLSDTICKNADRICVLAQQLGGADAYANETCVRGNESCKTSRERCCACL